MCERCNILQIYCHALFSYIEDFWSIYIYVCVLIRFGLLWAEAQASVAEQATSCWLGWVEIHVQTCRIRTCYVYKINIYIVLWRIYIYVVCVGGACKQDSSCPFHHMYIMFQLQGPLFGEKNGLMTPGAAWMWALRRWQPWQVASWDLRRLLWILWDGSSPYQSLTSPATLGENEQFSSIIDPKKWWFSMANCDTRG